MEWSKHEVRNPPTGAHRPSNSGEDTCLVRGRARYAGRSEHLLQWHGDCRAQASVPAWYVAPRSNDCAPGWSERFLREYHGTADSAAIGSSRYCGSAMARIGGKLGRIERTGF